jgi:hypothetical protein
MNIKIQRGDLSQIYIPKLVSLNPDRSEEKRLNLLLDEYRDYIMAFYKSPYLKEGEQPKYFNVWLDTEI